jgi:hypothetical protein
MESVDTLTGWHYTTMTNWKKIQEDGGLTPYLIEKPELKQFFPLVPINGVWVWARPLTGLSHAGSVIFQAQKGDCEVVKLMVEYPKDKILKVDGMYLKLMHVGTIGELKYHDGKEEAIICTEKIPLSQITLTETYDIVKLLNV